MASSRYRNQRIYFRLRIKEWLLSGGVAFVKERNIRFSPVKGFKEGNSREVGEQRTKPKVNNHHPHGWKPPGYS